MAAARHAIGARDHDAGDHQTQVVDGCIGVERPAEQPRRFDRDAVGATHPGSGQVQHHEMKQDLCRDRRQRQIETLNPDGSQSKHQTEQGGAHTTDRQRDPERHAALRREQRGGVRARAHERRLAQVDLTGKTGVDLQPDHHHGGDQHRRHHRHRAGVGDPRQSEHEHNEQAQRHGLASRADQRLVLVKRRCENTCGIHAHTLSMVFQPNMPVGRINNIKSMMMKGKTEPSAPPTNGSR